MPVIYIDELLAVNMIVDFFLLRLCCWLLHATVTPLRFLLGSGLGAIGSLLLLIDMPFAVGTICKCLLMIVMTLVTFRAKSFRAFLRVNSVFFGVNVAFAGLMLFLWYQFSPQRFLYKNGAVYCNVDMFVLVGTAVICYVTLTLVSVLSQKRTMRGTVYVTELITETGKVKGKALYDTGNSLRDSFSGRPVIVAGKGFAKNIYPDGFLNFLTDNIFTDTGQGFRMIPFSTLGTEGVLPAFRVKTVRFFAQGKWQEQENVFVAISQNKIGGGEYDMLFGTPLFQTENREVKAK